MSDLQVDPSLWATDPVPRAQASSEHSAPRQQSAYAAPQKKMMSLEEVEAAMRRQSKRNSPAPQPQQQSQKPELPSYAAPQMHQQPSQSSRPLSQQGSMANPQPMQILRPLHHPTPPLPSQREPNSAPQQSSLGQPVHYGEKPSHLPPGHVHTRAPLATQSNEAGHTLHGGQFPTPQLSDGHAPQPRQILQNPDRHSADLDIRFAGPTSTVQKAPRVMTTSQNGGNVSLPIITHPSQLADLTEEQRRIFMADDAKRAKRNHKIYLLSKGNGLMTPQDKNFITRIQLQQLMSATGNVNEQDPDISLAEDFYYQVYNQIENRPRQHPNQPLGNFAQTYLFQTGGHNGGMNRRQNRGDNHMHRMQQQVQRAVEAAKAKPKNKQLVIEGSLGKISFSNAKTPKPLLNIKRNESNDVVPRPGSKKPSKVALSTTDRKAILKNIEAVYLSLMKIEDHDRRIPQPPLEDHDPASAEPYVEWRRTFKQYNRKLWSDLKVLEPIMPESTLLHPFIAFLSYPKGKKAIPRIFAHIDEEQRLTILTIIVIQLDALDVVRSALPHISPAQSSITAREQIDLFLQTVMPSLLSNVTEAPLSIIIGLVGLVTERINIPTIVRSQVGLEILTMLLSQAEIIRKAEASKEQEWQQWLGIYNRLFDIVEPLLAGIFPGSVSAGQDVYVWQFMATLGTGANPDQQQRLVLAVKFVTRVLQSVKRKTNHQLLGIVSWIQYSRARHCRPQWQLKGEATSTFSCRLLALTWICLMGESTSD